MLRELSAKAKTINIKKLALQVAKANAGLILERQIEQLSVGENSDGGNIGTYKSAKYASLKRRMGTQAPFMIPDLKFSGELYKNVKVKFTDTNVLINSTVSYSKYNVQRYGANIYGLQESNQEDVKFKNSGEIVKEYVKSLGL